MWIEPNPHKPVLHIVDCGTRFPVAKFLKDETSEDVWNPFVECCVSVCVGFPNVLGHDQGSAFTSNFFTSRVSSAKSLPRTPLLSLATR